MVISQDPQMANLDSQRAAGIGRAIAKGARCMNDCNSAKQRQSGFSTFGKVNVFIYVQVRQEKTGGLVKMQMELWLCFH